MKSRRLSQKDPINSVKQFIQRIIGDRADPDDFIINFDATLNSDDLDTFEVLDSFSRKLIIKNFIFKLEMDNTNLKVIITANSINAATWGFNYYLKYICNSSVFWSGKKINFDRVLPVVPEKIRVTANDQYVKIGKVF